MDDEYQQDEFTLDNQGVEQEQKPFEKPKEGIIIVLDCHQYPNTTGVTESMKHAILRMIRVSPIHYPKDRFCLIFYGVKDTTEGFPKGIKLVHKLGNAKITMLSSYTEYFNQIDPIEITENKNNSNEKNDINNHVPLENVFEATNMIFKDIEIVNQRRVVFVVPTQFFEYQLINENVNKHLAQFGVNPLFFSEKTDCEEFPFKIFPLCRFERVCIAFHKSFGYYYDFVPIEGMKEKVIVNNTTSTISASSLGNVDIEIDNWRIVQGKLRVPEMPNGEQREMKFNNQTTQNNTFKNNDSQDNNDNKMLTEETREYENDLIPQKLLFSEEEYQSLHRIDKDHKCSIVVKSRMGKDTLLFTTKPASFMRPLKDNGWYGALYQSLRETKQYLRCDFYTLTTMYEIALVPLESNVDAMPSGLYIVYLPYKEDIINYAHIYLTEDELQHEDEHSTLTYNESNINDKQDEINSSKTQKRKINTGPQKRVFNFPEVYSRIERTNLQNDQIESMCGLIDSYTIPSFDILSMRNPLIEERITKIIDAMKINLNDATTIDTTKDINYEPFDLRDNGNLQNVKDNFPGLTITTTKTQKTKTPIGKLSNEQILEIYQMIDENKGHKLTVDELKQFLRQSNVYFSAAERKFELLARAVKLVSHINEQLYEDGEYEYEEENVEIKQEIKKENDEE